MGISRDEEIKGVDGFEAVMLWKKWDDFGDRDALNTLIEYNRADTVNLTAVAERVYEKLVREYAGFVW